jgi:DNA-binding response OmpR family regulator
MKLLLIEDDERIATALTRGLEGEGFSVDAVTDGTDGLHQAMEGTYDALIVDLMLPGTNGFKICDSLRQADDWTPIMVLTAKEGDLDQTEALDTGADDYLTKPFSFPVLVSRLHALLRRSAAGGDSAKTQQSVGDLRIDSRSRRVWRGEAEVELTARQFDVLEFFMRRPGEVMTRDEILLGVWDYQFDGDPNIVEVYVGRLRRAIDAPFGRQALETVRGAGYRLDPDGG